MPRVLVTGKSDKFSRILCDAGFQVTNAPAIKTVARRDLRFLENLVNSGKYDGAFITSRAAAEAFVPFAAFFSGRVHVLGSSSYAVLKDVCSDLFYDKTANDASEMLAKIDVTSLEGKHFLFICGDRSLRTVPEFLETIASVDSAVVYETQNVIYSPELTAELENSTFSFVCFFSPSGFESFAGQVSERFFENTKIAAIGKTTADIIESRGFKVDLISPNANAEDFAKAIIAEARA